MKKNFTTKLSIRLHAAPALCVGSFDKPVAHREIFIRHWCTHWTGAKEIYFFIRRIRKEKYLTTREYFRKWKRENCWSTPIFVRVDWKGKRNPRLRNAPHTNFPGKTMWDCPLRLCRKITNLFGQNNRTRKTGKWLCADWKLVLERKLNIHNCSTIS